MMGDLGHAEPRTASDDMDDFSWRCFQESYVKREKPVRMVGPDRGALEEEIARHKEAPETVWFGREGPAPSVQCRFRDRTCTAEIVVQTAQYLEEGTKYSMTITLDGPGEAAARFMVCSTMAENAGAAMEKAMLALSRVVGELTDVLPQGPDL